MSKRIRCKCGSVILPSYYDKHLLTKRHLNNIEEEEEKEDDGLKLTEGVVYIGDRNLVGKVDTEEHLNSCACVIF